MDTYTVTMRHDTGTVAITTTATSPDSAARIVCAAEGAPRRSVQSVTLLDDAPAGAWVIEHAMMNCAPDAEGRRAFAEREDAWVALFDMAREYADEDDEQWWDADGEDAPMRAVVDSITLDLAASPVEHTGGHSFWVEDNQYRRIYFTLRHDPSAVATD